MTLVVGTPDDPACEPRRRDLARRMLACNVDELDVMDALLARLEKGRDDYGLLDLDKARDWDRELAEELLDVQVYRAIAAVRERRARANEIAVAPPGVAMEWEMPADGERFKP